jgi:hypothetical protein
MKTIFKTIFILLFVSQTFAQNKRIEIPVPPNWTDFFTIPVGNKGVVLLNKVGRAGFNLVHFNTNLEKVWNIDGSVDANLDYATHCYDGQNLYLLFSRFRTNTFEVVKVNLGPGFVERFQLISVDRMEISYFKAMNSVVFISGMVNDLPVVLYSDLVKKNLKVLPSAVKGNAEIQTMELDTTHRVVNVTYSVGNSKTYQLVVKTFDLDGRQVTQFGLDPQDQFAMMNGRLNWVSDSTQQILGTYGHKSSIGSSRGPTSQGIYFGSLQNDEVSDMKFHSFSDFQNFFNYLPERQRERMLRKIDVKREKGDDLRLDYRMLIHDVYKHNDQYIMVAESFSPEFRPNNNMGPMGWGGMGGGMWSMSPFMMSPFYNPMAWGYGNWGLFSPYSSYYGFGNRNREIFDGWKYTHAVVAAFDKDGNLLWDNSIEMKDVKNQTLKQMVNVRFDGGNKGRISYLHKGKIYVKAFDGNTVLSDVEVREVNTSKEGDIVRSSDEGTIENWYGQYYLAYGYQRIRNTQEGDRRNVFFMNKLSL